MFPDGFSNFEATLIANNVSLIISPKSTTGSEGFYSLENGVYNHMSTFRFH